MLITIYIFEVDGGASVRLMPTFVHKKINPEIFHENGKPRLKKFDKK